jgi:hypothetical protein
MDKKEINSPKLTANFLFWICGVGGVLLLLFWRTTYGGCCDRRVENLAGCPSIRAKGTCIYASASVKAWGWPKEQQGASHTVVEVRY